MTVVVGIGLVLIGTALGISFAALMVAVKNAGEIMKEEDDNKQYGNNH